jgi:hypothetical protein
MRNQTKSLDGTARRRRHSLNLSLQLERHLSTYAVAAGAAGVALLACAVPADAAPVCHVSTATLSGGATTFALNPALQIPAPFNLAQTFSEVSTMSRLAESRAFFTPNTPGAKIVIAGNGLPADLAPGSSIGPAANFSKAQSYGLLFTYLFFYRNVNSHLGNLKLGPINYLGFQFSIDRQIHYGWVRLQATKGWTTHILGWGYETAPNLGILAGACNSESASNPLPATLGALALGSQGLPLLRKSNPRQ